MKHNRIKFHIEGYDHCYTGLETSSSYFVSKYIVKKHGKMLPITQWIIDVEWMTKKQINRILNL